MEGSCLFCKIAAGKAPSKKIWESSEYIAIENKFPKALVHLLVMPKKHESKEAIAAGESNPVGLLPAVYEVVRLKGLDKTGYKLVINGGGYNHFDHEHVHVLGGTEGEPGGTT